MRLQLNLPKLSDMNLPKLADLKRLQKKHWMYIACSVLGVLLVAGGITLAVILMGPGTPKILEQPQPEPADVSKFVRSERFSKLPEEQKVAFVEKIVDNEYYDDKYETMFNDVPKEEAERLGEQFRPVFMKVINKKLDEYFRMDKQAKLAFMDKFLDRIDRGMKRAANNKDANKNRQAMRGNHGGQGGQGWPGRSEKFHGDHLPQAEDAVYAVWSGYACPRQGQGHEFRAWPHQISQPGNPENLNN